MAFTPVYAFFQKSPALTRLGRLYGASFQNMPRRDLMAVIHALTECTYIVMEGAESEHLGIVASEIHEHEFENPDIPQILNELDEEIDDIATALSLIEVLASAASIGIQEYA